MEAKKFYNLPAQEKEKNSLKNNGTSLHGWLPLHAELTAGCPDGREIIYIGKDTGRPMDLTKMSYGSVKSTSR